jgi:uncharacterized protein involved in exopolysaccharide biosynthesis
MELWAAIAPRRWLILILALVCGASAFAASFLVKPVFSADVLLAPVTQGASGGMGSLTSQYAGIASLAGISLPGGGGNSAQQEAIATLESRVMINAFINERNLLPELFESRWDKAASRWKSDDPNKVPTVWEATRFFNRKVCTVSADKKTGLVTLTIKWQDPVEAADWANDLVSRTNNYLRNKAIDRAGKNLEFLQQQLEKTSVVEVRQSIYHLMENEIKTLTLAQGATDYAFKVIDPAVVPRRRVSPSRGSYLLGGMVFGGALGMMYALWAAARSRGRSTP